jgi:hypothetical protein
MFICIKSGTSDFYNNQRLKWRTNNLKRKNNQINKGNIPVSYKFFIGIPMTKPLNPNSHNQGCKYNNSELKIMNNILKEKQKYKDIILLPHRDIYTELNLKMMQILNWVKYNTPNTKYICIHDDKVRINLSVLNRFIINNKIDNYKYFMGGNYLWKTPKFKTQYKFDGTFSPYFSGWCYIYNKALLNEILNDDNIVYTGILMGNAEDLQTGEWINRVKRRIKHPILMKEIHNLIIKV